MFIGSGPLGEKATTGSCPYPRSGLFGKRATTGGCPYPGIGGGWEVIGQKHDDAVHVIGHDDKCVDFDTGIGPGQFIPNGLHHFARWRRVHFAIDDLAQQTRAVLGADGDDVASGRAVIEVVEADRRASQAGRFDGPDDLEMWRWASVSWGIVQVRASMRQGAVWTLAGCTKAKRG